MSEEAWVQAREQDRDPDDLTRAQLAELPGPEPQVAEVLDEWLLRLHGVTSGTHGVGLFLDLLAAAGYRVTEIPKPAVRQAWRCPDCQVERVDIVYAAIEEPPPVPACPNCGSDRAPFRATFTAP